jgi:hypothetical protein
VIKWMVALRGDELDLEKKLEFVGNEYTAIEIARRDSKTEAMSLLKRFITNPTQIRHEIRVELGLVDEDAAELFTMMVFLCDDFLRIKEPSSASSSSSSSSNAIPDTATVNVTVTASRFFKITKGLPMELQMVLCYRVFGSGKENIKSKHSEAAFKHLAKTYNMSSSSLALLLVRLLMAMSSIFSCHQGCCHCNFPSDTSSLSFPTLFELLSLIL